MSFALLTLPLFLLFGDYLLRGVDPWIWDFPIQILIGIHALVAYQLFGKEIVRSKIAYFDWVIFLFIFPLTRSPIGGPTGAALWTISPIVYFIIRLHFAKLATHQLKPRPEKIASETNRTIVLLALLLAVAIRVILIFWSFKAGGPVDIGRSTMSALRHLLNGVCPYSVPEDPNISGIYHRQNYIYGPAVLYSYLPLALIVGPRNPLLIFTTNLFFDFAGALLLFYLSKQFISENRAKSLSVIWLFNPILLNNNYLRGSNDCIPLALALAALYCASSGRWALCAALSALGFGTKWWPIIGFAYIFLCVPFKKHPYTHVRLLLSFALTSVAVFLPFIIWSPADVLEDLLWPGSRPLDSWEKSISLQYLLTEGMSLPLLFVATAVSFAYQYSSKLQKIAADLFSLGVLYCTFTTVMVFVSFANTIHHNYIGWFHPILPVLFLMLANSTSNEDNASTH